MPWRARQRRWTKCQSHAGSSVRAREAGPQRGCVVRGAGGSDGTVKGPRGGSAAPFLDTRHPDRRRPGCSAPGPGTA